MLNLQNLRNKVEDAHMNHEYNKTSEVSKADIVNQGCPDWGLIGFSTFWRIGFQSG